MKTVLCLACRHWFDGKAHACPDCGWERPKFNKPLRTAMLNNHLYAQAEAQGGQR